MLISNQTTASAKTLFAMDSLKAAPATHLRVEVCAVGGGGLNAL